MPHITPTINGLREAVETGDTASLKSFFADEAVMTIIDSVNTPSKPRVIKGAKEIGAFFDDVYSRDMTHSVESGVVDGTWLAYVERCEYRDGTRVVAACSAELGPTGIVKHTTVQAWDS